MRRLLCACALLLGGLTGCDDDTTATDGGADLSAQLDMTRANQDLAQSASAQRGEYLVKSLLVCGDCHTTPDQNGFPSSDPAAFLAGGRDFPLFGLHVYARNLTPDNATGLGTWTLDQIVTAIRDGRDKAGLALVPVMPYFEFHNLTDLDAMSIALYLKSLAPQSHAVPQSTLMVQQPFPAIDASKIPASTLAAGDPNRASADRGRYLATVACVSCHTEHLQPGAASVIDYTKLFAGGDTFALAPGFTTISANLTPSATGLGGWTVNEIVQTLKTDQERGVGHQLCPPMPGGPGRLGSLTDGDLTDIANYIHTVPPITNGPFGCTDGGVPYGLPDGG